MKFLKQAFYFVVIFIGFSIFWGWFQDSMISIWLLGPFVAGIAFFFPYLVIEFLTEQYEKITGDKLSDEPSWKLWLFIWLIGLIVFSIYLYLETLNL